MSGKCECADGGCPCCKGRCTNDATTVLYRVDMEDRTGTAMCQGCAEDAWDSGLFHGEAEHELQADEELDNDGDE